MHVTRIEFRGYQRLADTGCNTDGKMIAFLGPNEAGKTTVLNALNWFSNGDEPLADRSKSSDPRPSDRDVVVRVRYWLEKEDLKLLDGLAYEGTPKNLIVSKRADGTRFQAVAPKLSRPAAPFSAAREALVSLAQKFPSGDLDSLSEEISTVDSAFSDANASWDSAWDEPFNALTEWLNSAPDPDAEEGEEERKPRDPQTARTLQIAKARMASKHPNDEAASKLYQKSPEFVLFTDEDRALRTSYDLADDALRQSPPPALENLRWVADLDLEALWRAEQNNDRRTALNLQRKANELLHERLGKKWSQKNITVNFKVNGQFLEINIHELDDDGADTPFDERSDGLKTFVTLVAFLARQNFEMPPVLLLDEAETHLHLDAQADLIDVLTHDVDAVQVFYSTHSPGCLPRDMGTGIRLVSPLAGRLDASELRNDFWTSDQPGFTPLLFAMGAGAAAFSAFRKAVLTEGASEMILFPTMMRAALKSFDLAYQVAPGISSYNGTGLELEEVASRVAYLVDGDQGGETNRDRLIGMGIDRDRIFSFETNKALEDYLDVNQYLDVVNALMGLSDPDAVVKHEDLSTDVPIAKAIEDWCTANGRKAPGKTVVAAQLVNRAIEEDTLGLAPGAAEVLLALHEQFLTALTNVGRDVPAPSDDEQPETV